LQVIANLGIADFAIRLCECAIAADSTKVAKATTAGSAELKLMSTSIYVDQNLDHISIVGLKGQNTFELPNVSDIDAFVEKWQASGADFGFLTTETLRTLRKEYLLICREVPANQKVSAHPGKT
jgi:hypothetical protein